MVLAGVVAGFLAIPLGLLFVAGFGLADLLIYDGSPLAWRLGLAGHAGLLMTYLAFALLVAAAPMLTGALTGLFGNARALRGLVPRAALTAATAAGVLFVAVQPVPLLIRPLYVWVGSSPSVQAMDLVQRAIWLIAGAGAAAAAIRILLEAVAWDQDPAAVIDVSGEPPRQPAGRAPRSPPVAGPLVSALVGTLLLAGLTPTWAEAVFVFAGLLMVSAARVAGARLVPAWPRLAERVPLAVRLAVVLAASYWLSSRLMGPYGPSGSSFLPMIRALLASLAVAAIAFPAPARPAATSAAPPPGNGSPGETRP